MGIAITVLATITLLAVSLFALPQVAAAPKDMLLVDSTRQRSVPVTVFEPAASACKASCPVAVFGTGYGATVEEYTFLLTALAAQGFFVVGVQHDLSSDAPMPNTGNIVQDRTPFWLRGAQTIEFSVRELASRFPGHLWSSPVLLGHSQGGDIAAWLASHGPSSYRALVTLDNRRVALPDSGALPTLSFRSSDQQADPGVLPGANASHVDNVCIVRMPGTRHDDMNNRARPEAQTTIQELTLRFLKQGRCIEGKAS